MIQRRNAGRAAGHAAGQGEHPYVQQDVNSVRNESAAEHLQVCGLLRFDRMPPYLFVSTGLKIFLYCQWSTSFAVSYTHLRAHETRHDLVCRLLLEKKK